MNSTPECSPPPVQQPIDCPQPPVIIQQPKDCPLPPVTNINQNIYVDTSASDATLNCLQPCDSDVSLSNATSRQTTDCEYSQSCATDIQTSDVEYIRPNKPNSAYYSQSNQTSDNEYSRTNLRNKPSNDCQRPPVITEECPQPPIAIKECPKPPPVVAKECPSRSKTVKECSRSSKSVKASSSRSRSNLIKECPSRSKEIKECSRSSRSVKACSSRSRTKLVKESQSRSRSNITKECPLPPIVIKECPLPPIVIKECPQPPINCQLPPIVIKECPQPCMKICPLPPVVAKECPTPPPVVAKVCPSGSKVSKVCSRSSKAIKECSRSSKSVKACSSRSRSKLIKESQSSSRSKTIKECPLPSVVLSQNIQAIRPLETSKPPSSLRSNIISTQSTNYDRSLSKVPTQQASNALGYSGPTVVNEQETLLRTQSEPTLGQKSQAQSKVATTAKSSHTQIKFELIRSESRLTLERSLSEVLKPGLSGLREFMSSSLTNTSKGSSFLESDLPHLNKFIDYFIECDGLRFMGILEQIEYDFDDRVKAALLNARPNTQAEAQYLRDKLVNIGQVQPAYQQISLKEIDFPELLNKEMKILSFDYKPKIDAIRRIHVYGLEMEKYWLTQLNTGKNVDKVEVYDIGTQMLAELMAQLFSLLVKSCEFLMEVNEDVKMYTGKLSAESLIHLFTEFRRLLVEEVGAVGETCGSVMVHIPYLKDDDIIEIMTKLYNQVNFVDICICRALKPVVPLVLLFDCQRVTAPTYDFTQLS